MYHGLLVFLEVKTVGFHIFDSHEHMAVTSYSAAVTMSHLWLLCVVMVLCTNVCGCWPVIKAYNCGSSPTAVGCTKCCVPTNIHWA